MLLESEVVADLMESGTRIIHARSLRGGRVQRLDEFGFSYTCVEDLDDVN